MSDFGFKPSRGDGGNSPAPAYNDSAARRDPWGNPIQEPPQRTQQNNNNNNNNNNSGDGNGNDDGIDENTLDTIWDGIKKKTGEEDDDKNKNLNTDPPPDPKKQLEEYLTSVGLEPVVISDQDKEAMANGDFSVLNKFNEKIRQAHIKAMSGSKTMIDAAVETAVQRALAGANSQYEGKMNLSALHTALPFTKDKVIGPVAQTVMQKFLDRGASTEDAIKGVRKFFAHSSEKYGTMDVNKNRNGNFAGSRPNSSDNAPEGGWLSVLRAKS